MQVQVQALKTSRKTLFVPKKNSNNKQKIN